MSSSKSGSGVSSVMILVLNLLQRSTQIILLVPLVLLLGLHACVVVDSGELDQTLHVHVLGRPHHDVELLEQLEQVGGPYL